MKKNRILNKILLICILVFCTVFIPFNGNISNKVYAQSENKYVALGGDAIGLRIETEVYITGKFEVNTITGKVKPWKDSDLQIDDIIIEIDNHKIVKIKDIKEILNEHDEEYVTIKVKRDNKIIVSNILICENLKGENTIGLYVKDNILGVGTLTYYDLNTKKFGALGHSAIDTNVLSGTICSCKINGIIKGMRGQPGEKEAILGKKSLGTIEKNNQFGVFGTFNNVENAKYNLIAVAEPHEVEVGKAFITTVLDNNIKENFEVEIIEVKKQFYEDIKGIKIKVTDEKLLEKTGGIIQGMSGSPIIQNGKLVGAVSHVLVNDSCVGYGVFAKWMIEQE